MSSLAWPGRARALARATATVAAVDAVGVQLETLPAAVAFAIAFAFVIFPAPQWALSAAYLANPRAAIARRQQQHSNTARATATGCPNMLQVGVILHTAS